MGVIRHLHPRNSSTSMGMHAINVEPSPPHLRRNFWMHCLEGAVSLAILLTIPEVRVKAKTGHASPALGEDTPMV